jgi:MFS family permease
MAHSTKPLPATVAAATGLAGLAAAMGIGRFAFTPLLPLMQAEASVTLTQGAWLAGANYLGYFAGAMASFAVTPRPGASARWGLAVVALSTLAMGMTSTFEAWMVLRFAAGIASAFVLVGAAAWAMAQLAAGRALARTGWVFAGVGLGIMVAGLAVLVAGALGVDAATTWRALGGLSAAVAVATWRAFGSTAAPTPPAGRAVTAATAAPATAAATTNTGATHAMRQTGSTGAGTAGAASARQSGRGAVTLTVAYGLFGVGYIVPATFIPAAARSLVADPAVFGWAWPLFGAAAFGSTIAIGSLLPHAPPRRLAAVGLWVMAIGVLAPALRMNLVALMFSAIAVGGTLIVVTMACMQEATRIAPESPTRLLSGMTAAFAFGQAVGPLAVRTGASAAQAIVGPSVAAAALLAIAALALHRRPAARPQERVPLDT